MFDSLAVAAQELTCWSLAPALHKFLCAQANCRGFWLPCGRMNLSELPNIPAARMRARKDFEECGILLVSLLDLSWTRIKASLVWQRVELSSRAHIRPKP
ncbi:Lhfpl Tetraspan Subfamily Member 6 Protein [Manis pentadactyla]|nr:Lhfpl Tetraspan Subfamily Member 6 Protein [Manis pentadactyla]